MTADLSLLPLWYGDTGDYVLVDKTTEATQFLSSLPSSLLPPVMPVSLSEPAHRIAETGDRVEAAPWGLSPQSARLFESLRKQITTLATLPFQETHIRLTGRRTAAECLHRVRTLLPEMQAPALPCFCTTPDEIRHFMAAYHPPFLLKMPYSCSGRGLYRLTKNELDEPALRWIGGALKRQNEVSIEQALDKVCDFAMEFISDGNGQTDYVGLSVFNTQPKGAFDSCLLGSPDFLESKLLSCVSDTLLWEVRKAVATALTETFGSLYKGYLGVDMLIYRHAGTFAVHPVVEVNLRYTMGLVALQLSRRWIHPATRGQLVIACDYGGVARKSHQEMKRNCPLTLEDGKIRAGYFSLCPVTSETQYRAYVLAG
jgi:hypothetical protein